MRVQPVATDLSRSPLHPVSFSDSFVIETAQRLTAIEAAHIAIGHVPAWVRCLMALRNALVAPLGLKHDPAAMGLDARLIGFFPVLSEAPDRVVLGLDDRHLDFRVTVDVTPLEQGTRVVASTYVLTHNLFGRAYLAAVMPFHRIIVPAMLGQLEPRQDSHSRGVGL